MHVDRIPNRTSPPAFLLRETYREGGKVKKRTLANITHWPAGKIEALRRLLRDEYAPDLKLAHHIDAVECRFGVDFGGVARKGETVVNDIQIKMFGHFVFVDDAAGEGTSPAPANCYGAGCLLFNPIFDFGLALVEARFIIGGARASKGPLHTNRFSALAHPGSHPGRLTGPLSGVLLPRRNPTGTMELADPGYPAGLRLQAGGCLLVLDAVFVGEHVDGDLGGRAGRRPINLPKVCLHVDLDREGDLVEHVGSLMDPTPPMPGAGKGFFDCLPEAERTIADREVGRDLEPTSLDVDEEFTPALRALPHPGLEADEFLLALGCGADQHQHAFGVLFHSRLQVDPVRPHVDVTPRRQVAFLPGVVIGLPLRRQPRDHGWRQVRRVLAQQGAEGLLEVAGRHPAQVENRQQRVEALGPQCPLRQDRRGEAHFLIRLHVSAVAHLGTPDRDWPDPGLDGPLRSMAVQHHAVAAIRQLEVLPLGDEGVSFRDQHLCQLSVGAKAIDVVLTFFMALLSFRGIGTPSLPAQGEQRCSSYFNIRGGNPRRARRWTRPLQLSVAPEKST
jgi:hypothetical protein